MKAIILIVVALLTVAYAQKHGNFAVLVAGSNGYYNYRHQADICHAYQILTTKGGYQPSNIIVFAYNDIAKSPSNPFKGQIFNKPSQGPGKDVYKGCKIDYQGADVTPQNFLAVLEGRKEDMIGIGSERVLESGPNDRVFINFSDHGAAGLIAFPSSYLYVDALQKTLDYMQANMKYYELTFYLESCESGSMFQQLKKTSKQYGLSASSPSESSWGCYCSPEDVVDGTHLGSCLGDLFSVSWMEECDIADFTKEKLIDHYQITKTKTTMSAVMQWGDLSFQSEPIGYWFAAGQGETSESVQEIVSPAPEGLQDSRLIKVHYLINQFNMDPSDENRLALTEELMINNKFDQIFSNYKQTLGLTGMIGQTTDFECYRNLVDTLNSSCVQVNDYGLKYLKYLYESCETQQSDNLMQNLLMACAQTI